MSEFIFHLQILASCGIAITSMIGLFLIMLVLNNISFQRSNRHR